jgi:hypothetical protein
MITADSIMYAQQRLCDVLNNLQIRQRIMKAELETHLEARDLQSAASRQQMITGLVMAETLVRDELKELSRRFQNMVEYERAERDGESA